MNDVFALPVKTVLQDFGVVFVGGGDTQYALSPFREESKITNFTISISRNCWKDWTLDIAGGPVQFVMKIKNCDKPTAMQYLKYKYFGEGKPVLGSVQAVNKICCTKKEATKPAEAASAEMLNKAYEIFLGFCKLNNESREYLLGRGISESEIEKVGFKSFPSRAIKMKVLKAFEESNIDPFKIPGFYRDVKVNKPTFIGGKETNILIPVRDYNGNIVALQFRRAEVKKDEARYSWFSSAKYLIGDTEGDKGTSPGCPINYEPGGLKKPKTVFITEGLFKSLAITRTWHSPVLSVQGVGNWKGTLEILNKLKTRGMQRVIVAYDADFCTNRNVAEQAKLLMMEIEKIGLKTGYLSWDLEIGKGIDDYLQTKPSKWRLIEKDVFDKAIAYAETMCQHTDTAENKKKFRAAFESKLG